MSKSTILEAAVAVYVAVGLIGLTTIYRIRFGITWLLGAPASVIGYSAALQWLGPNHLWLSVAFAALWGGIVCFLVLFGAVHWDRSLTIESAYREVTGLGYRDPLNIPGVREWGTKTRK